MKENKKNSYKQIAVWLKELQTGYQSLLKNMEVQKLAVDQYDENGILKTIQKKEHLLAHLVGLDQKVQATVNDLSDAEHQKVIKKTETILSNMESTLDQIIMLERYCETTLEQQKSGLKVKMQSIKQVKTSLKGYGTGSLRGSNFSKNV